MGLRRAKRRQQLFAQGDRAAHTYVIRRGRVKLVKADAQGTERVVALLNPGDLFGIETLLGVAHSTRAEVLADAEFCVGAQSIMGPYLEQSAFQLELAQYLHRQLDDARAQLACAGAVGTRARLANYLLSRVQPADALTVPRDLTLAELGTLISASPETVCRLLSSLRSHGVISIDREVIRISEPAVLRALGAGAALPASGTVHSRTASADPI